MEIFVKAKKMNAGCAVLSIALLLFSANTQVFAHGGGNWDPFTIDRVNNDAEARVLQLQQQISNLIRARTEADVWPMPELQGLRDGFFNAKEEVDEVLEHFVSDGANLQLTENLRAEPRMGRTAAASRSLEASITLIAHAATLESKDAFVKEFYSRGPAAILYELLEAHKDRMDLYGELIAIAEQSEKPEE